MIDLKMIRHACGRTQKQVAAALGLTEVSGRQTVGQIEARSDWLLSSIAAYIRACGAAQATLVVTTENGEEVIQRLV